MKPYYVYTHSINGIVFYVGSKTGKTDRAHDKKQRNKHWHKIVDENNGVYDVNIVKYFDDKSECIKYEMKLIKDYHDKNQALASHQDYRGNLNSMYGNSRFGKENPFYNKKHTKETKDKISKTKKGTQTGENNPMYGKKHSDESRKKMSINNGMRDKPAVTRRKVLLTLNDTTIKFECVEHLKIYLKNKYNLSEGTTKTLLRTGKSYELKKRSPKRLQVINGLTLTYENTEVIKND